MTHASDTAKKDDKAPRILDHLESKPKDRPKGDMMGVESEVTENKLEWRTRTRRVDLKRNGPKAGTKKN